MPDCQSKEPHISQEKGYVGYRPFEFQGYGYPGLAPKEGANPGHRVISLRMTPLLFHSASRINLNSSPSSYSLSWIACGIHH